MLAGMTAAHWQPSPPLALVGGRSAPSASITAQFASAVEFDVMAAEWDELLARSRSHTLFLSWEWLRAWWRHWGEGKELKLVLVRNETGSLIGVCPLCLTRSSGIWPVRTLRFLGSEMVGSDYLDAFAEPGLEAEVAGAILELLDTSRREWDIVELTDGLPTSLVHQELAAIAPRLSMIASSGPGQICPFLPLPPTAAELTASLSQRTRRYFGQKRRKFEKAGGLLRRLETEAEVLQALPLLFDLHERRWNLKGLQGNFKANRVRAFHFEVAPLFFRRGWLRFYEATLDGKTQALLYAFQGPTTFSYYQSGFLPESSAFSPGGILLALGAENAIREGRQVFDFLRGPEPYKGEWTHSLRETRSLRLIHRRNLAVRMRNRAWLTRNSARRLFKRILQGESAKFPAPPPDAPSED